MGFTWIINKTILACRLGHLKCRIDPVTHRNSSKEQAKKGFEEARQNAQRKRVTCLIYKSRLLEANKYGTIIWTC